MVKQKAIVWPFVLGLCLTGLVFGGLQWATVRGV